MKKYSKQQFSALLLALAASFVSVSCADEDIAKSQTNDSKDGVSFSVTDVQDAPDGEMPTRATSTETYLTHSIDFNEVGTSDMCLEETTVPGVNPVKPTPKTRAWLKSTIDGNFGTLACKNGSATPDFFYNKEVNKDGKMLQPEVWTSAASTLKFYAVYPYMDGTNAKQQLVQPTTGSMPYIAFEASTDIANQTDLMTAETDVLNYTPTGGAPHVVPLKFYHALTAIRFGIGSNLSWNKTIKSIEFRGVYKNAQYSLATKTWSNHGSTENFKLDNINASTSGTLNTVIVKDGNTFLMVPQTVPAGAKIVITFSDNTHITANIGGKTWKAGTTKTYMMTEKNSNWDYQIETTDPATIAYNQTTSTDNYTVQSYRKDPTTNTFQPVKWEVVSYQESTDGGKTWSAESPNKPSWLTNLSLTEGAGGKDAEVGKPTVTKAIVDSLDYRNKALKNAEEKGSNSNPYNLANKTGGEQVENTANSYVISAPGYYRIPLVYGNAIKNGNTNESAYKTSNTGTNILSNFKDHNEQLITSPWITETNSGANKPNGAKLVWADESGLVETSSIGVNNSYLFFRVPKDKIKNGNAVIAATKGGVVVWSWHLWFTEANVLNTTKVTNFQKKDYYFTNENLGWKYTKWQTTTYSAPRKVKVKIRQLEKNGGNYKESTITITQNNGALREGYNTLYQFGRKDAFPGTDDLEGTFTKNGGNNMSIRNGIQHPETLYTHGSTWYSVYNQYNLWSMENTTTGFNDNAVVKTIYDPCPAGFKMPASNAFTGFTTTGGNTETKSQFNINGEWESGFHFNNKISSPDATVYFPASGYRNSENGSLFGVGGFGYYRSAVPSKDAGYGCYLHFNLGEVLPQKSDLRSDVFSVRPVRD
ncbi:fimbrillin family protein [Segatella oris]|uniref:fimbrillin family protein n=1 Tax=Segatella oris TaxID=28135 RepID=UPI0028E8BC91|nr:fimbrillin family protein [Segatella oris]